jgi:predicted transcriptional regulator
MTKPKSGSNDDAMSIGEIAARLFVTDRTVRNWLTDKGMPSQLDDRRRIFKWSEVLPWYVKMMAEEGGNTRKPTPDPPADDEFRLEPVENFDQALCRKTIAEADLKELELAVKRGEVVATADAARMMQDTAKNLQIAILGWPTLMVGQIFGIKDRARLFDVLTRSARELCRSLAKIQEPSEIKPGA